MAKLKRLILTEELRAHVGLVRDAEAFFDGPGTTEVDIEKVYLAEAFLRAIDEQEAELMARVRSIRPQRIVTPVVEVELRQKRSRRA